MPHKPWWTLPLLLGATLRTTRLATTDTITDPARAQLIHTLHNLHPPTARWTVELLTCPHCIGFWIAAAHTLTWQRWGHTRTWQTAAGTATLAYLTGHIAQRLDTGDD